MTCARRASSARILRLRTRRSNSVRSSVVSTSAIWRGSIPLLIQWIRATSDAHRIPAGAEATRNRIVMGRYLYQVGAQYDHQEEIENRPSPDQRTTSARVHTAAIGAPTT